MKRDVISWCGQMKRKVIRVTLTIAGQKEVFTVQGDNQLTSTGLRVLFNCMYGGGAVMPTAQIKIYGLPLDKMMKLFRVRWQTLEALMNRVRIDAGEEGETLYKVFEGNITFAYPEMESAPDVALAIDSQAAIFEHLRPVSPTQFEGENDVADMIKTLCDEMGYQFENNGVSKIIDTRYLPDTALAKIQALATHADIDLYIEQDLIAIAPKGVPRKLKIPIISPSTGLIGYPTPDLRGVSFKCLYNPAIRFGGVVSIQDSEIAICNADWRAYGVWLSLEANVPNGNWSCEVNATYLDTHDAVKK